MLAFGTRVPGAPTMPRPKPKGSRKQPRQARSRELVEALLDATARVLVRHGWDGATTNRIAERAGVSVGSLYQYFPNKEALAAALVDRHAHRMQSALESVPMTPDDPETFIRASIRGVLKAFAVHPALRNILVEQVPTFGRSGKLGAFDAWLRARVAGQLMELGGIERARADVLAWVLTSAVKGATMEPERTRPPGLDDSVLEDELVALATAYLAPVLTEARIGPAGLERADSG